ncbi:MAG: DUF4954 family protein, partial [Planctomycetota bacterium]|nr:DUF4954 family protein [Planctomycetota bacterium]
KSLPVPVVHGAALLHAVVEDVGVVESTPGAAFGCGTVVDALNEGGGRGVTLYPELSAQVAYILSLHRHRPELIRKIESMIAARVARAKAGRGTIGAHAQVRGVQTIRNVAIGPMATVWGAAELGNGTILSEPQAPTVIGSAVVAHDFIVAEGASVTDGALLAHCYVGQGCRIGKQFSAEQCLFFANCEAFHGEGCAAFGGPFTVTHHKSTLLIAALFSFYNAGSGTNQSNHMYKLGPLHQGILERGCKTGSFSYLLWPCRVGPFSVVIGKNMATFDLGDLPFSYIEAHGNKSYVTPGYNLYTVGTVRDGAKWLARDRRKASVKRDLVNAAVFSPYVAGRLLRGEKLLGKLAAETDRAVDEVNVNGALVRRLILKSGAKYYTLALETYLTEKLVARAEPALAQGLDAVRKLLAPELDGAKDREWLDLCGLLVARDRYAALAADVESGAVADLETLQARLAACHAAYERDEWNWVASVWEERLKVKPHEMACAALAEAANRLLSCRTKVTKMILADAEREFSQVTQIGFGADGGPDARTADFEAVRGTYAGNKFVVEMNAELAALTKRVSEFTTKIAAMG